MRSYFFHPSTRARQPFVGLGHDRGLERIGNLTERSFIRAGLSLTSTFWLYLLISLTLVPGYATGTSAAQTGYGVEGMLPDYALEQSKSQRDASKSQRGDADLDSHCATTVPALRRLCVAPVLSIPAFTVSPAAFATPQIRAPPVTAIS